MFIHISEGNRCWVVSLAKKSSMFGWITLAAFPNKEEAILYASELTALEISVASTERR